MHAHHELLKTSSSLLLLLSNHTCFQTHTDKIFASFIKTKKKLNVVINEAHSVILISMDDHLFISTLSKVKFFKTHLLGYLYLGRGCTDEQVPRQRPFGAFEWII